MAIRNGFRFARVKKKPLTNLERTKSKHCSEVDDFVNTVENLVQLQMSVDPSPQHVALEMFSSHLSQQSLTVGIKNRIRRHLKTKRWHSRTANSDKTSANVRAKVHFILKQHKTEDMPERSSTAVENP